jgi:hypothetical protein
VGGRVWHMNPPRGDSTVGADPDKA